MTAKRFKYTFEGIEDTFETDEEYKYTPCNKDGFQDLCEMLNELHEENQELRSRLKDWHQRTFKAHEYFNILEDVIDEVCDDDIGNQIWKEYEKREKLIE